MDNIIQNINKIDFELKNIFENVFITEKNIKNQHLILIDVNSVFLFESCKKRVNIKIEINKFDLVGNNIKWTYLTNPLNESSDKIERVSDISTITNDILDIVNKKRMVTEYFESLEPIFDKINENFSEKEVEITDKIKNIVSKYISITTVDKVLIENKQFTDTKPGYKFILKHDGEIKLSDMFKIEQNINCLPNVNYTTFKENHIEVDYSNK